jgi:wyosine [tRNA(Phe)-imidazoG37] synthetase (radical SAM superfamily)
MSRIHFHQTIFGPVISRRLGISLGVNLLPTDFKLCTFNCVYCECGWTEADPNMNTEFVPAGEILRQLEERLSTMTDAGEKLDSITLAGNGEPTVHPEFPTIVDGIIEIRKRYYPSAKISVLSNATMLGIPEILEALRKVDNNIQKVDAGTEATFQLINQPKVPVTLEKIVENLKLFRGQLVVQTLFLRGEFNGVMIDNTTEEEVLAWLALIKQIKPRRVMLYPIERKTPMAGLEKVTKSELAKIAARVERMGVCAEFFD